MASVAKRPDGRYLARYRNPAGKEHVRTFDRKIDARRWLDEVTASIVTGQYVAPNAGKVTFRGYAEQWRSAQVHRPSTAAWTETMLRRHAYPVLGDLPLGSVLPSQIQAWVAGVALAPSTATTLHGVVAGIFKAAVRDRRIAANPCEGTRLPKTQPRRVEPPTTEQVQALIAATAERARAAVILGAGTGMRQGEVLGLTVDRVDFLRRTARVDRQLVTLAGGPRFGPPKTAASVRSVPLPAIVVEALAEHLREHPAGIGLDGERLMFTTETGTPWGRSNSGTASGSLRSPRPV